MNNCEIVDNVACGQAFKYCRTHKVEPKDCPGNKAEPALDTHSIHLELAARYWGKGIVETLATEREFKVGDKVRRVDGMYGQMRPGHMGTITGFTPQGLLLAEFAGEHDERMFEVVK